MEERDAKDRPDIETWLLGFEKMAGRAVVVSLLIENQDIEFLSAVRSRGYALDENTEDPGDDAPTIDFEKAKLYSDMSKMNFKDYIG